MVIHVSKLVVSMLCLLVCFTLVLIPYLTLLNTSSVGESLDNATKVKIVANYTIYTNCIDDPFADKYGWITHTFFIKAANGAAGRSFNSISAGVIQSRSYSRYNAGITTVIGTSTYSWHNVEHVLLYYFTSTTTTSLTIRSYLDIGTYIGEWNTWLIPSRTYEAYNVYRYRLYFPVAQYTSSNYVMYFMPAIPLQDVVSGITYVLAFFNENGNSVSISSTTSYSFTHPASGSYTATASVMISFGNSADVGKSFKYLLIYTQHSSYGTLPHLLIIFDPPYTIQAVGDAISIQFTITLSSNI